MLERDRKPRTRSLETDYLLRGINAGLGQLALQMRRWLCILCYDVNDYTARRTSISRLPRLTYSLYRQAILKQAGHPALFARISVSKRQHITARLTFALSRKPYYSVVLGPSAVPLHAQEASLRTDLTRRQSRLRFSLCLCALFLKPVWREKRMRRATDVIFWDAHRWEEHACLNIFRQA